MDMSKCVYKIGVGGELLEPIEAKVGESAWDVVKRELGGATLEPLEISESVYLLFDEEGRLKHLPVNERATAYARLTLARDGYDVGDLWLCGDVYIVESDGDSFKFMPPIGFTEYRRFIHFCPRVKVPNELPEPTIKIIAFN